MYVYRCVYGLLGLHAICLAIYGFILFPTRLRLWPRLPQSSSVASVSLHCSPIVNVKSNCDRKSDLAMQFPSALNVYGFRPSLWRRHKLNS